MKYDVDFDEYEIPKHRKKSKKQNDTPKKSKHKHDYQIVSIKSLLNSRPIEKMDDTDTLMVTIEEECLICGKTKEDMKFLSPQEFLTYKERL